MLLAIGMSVYSRLFRYQPCHLKENGKNIPQIQKGKTNVNCEKSLVEISHQFRTRGYLGSRHRAFPSQHHNPETWNLRCIETKLLSSLTSRMSWNSRLLTLISSSSRQKSWMHSSVASPGGTGHKDTLESCNKICEFAFYQKSYLFLEVQYLNNTTFENWHTVHLQWATLLSASSYWVCGVAWIIFKSFRYLL